MKTNIIFKGLTLFLLITSCFSCKKFVTISAPQTLLVNQSVFTSDQTATSAILGIYSSMMTNIRLTDLTCTYYAALSADELKNYSADPLITEIYGNSISPTNADILDVWSDAYQFIYAANTSISGIASSNGMSIAVKQQLTGEAKFIRAYCYFYLVNFFGDVPLITDINYSTNAKAKRTSVTDVYKQIISDLKDAQNLLSDNYMSASNRPTTDRVRPNKWAATALLARVYLYTKDWKDAVQQTTNIINNTSQYSLVPDLNKVFLAGSKEAIWQLLPVTPQINTLEGQTFILTTSPTGTFASALSNQLINAFEPMDKRKIAWIDSIISEGQTFYFPYKYKVAAASSITEDYMVLRLAEQYLIRAEAETQLMDFVDAQNDINIIRSRAGLGPTLATTKTTLLQAILHERQVELFMEWGNRWFDLKRTGMIDAVLTPIKTNWKSTAALFPVPQTEIQNDNNLTQNVGY